ncbi:sulfite exporter TauE/SafE family protein [Notoacmeibacter marinus]|uniref:sulfite exporter TauE/SafE family protein n=1 Tax=Notoacmeibacter marinus TaxID=1876515 RepID=UPI000DF26DAD|nr:sulfite exporter TauE/SafE family protein [Notoacmeibacter marinus]
MLGFDPAHLAIIAFVFLLAGTVKGTIGIGLPTIAIAILTALIGLREAIVLALVPSFTSNVWQAVGGGQAIALVRRLWPLLLPAVMTVWIGALALTHASLDLLSAVLGIALTFYAGADLLGLRFTVDRRMERWAGPLVGAANGVLTGMTGSYVVPGVMFLAAIGLDRHALVQAMGILFTASTIALFLVLGDGGLLSPDRLALSALALIPTLVGMAVGWRMRAMLSETAFRRTTMVALATLGIYLVGRALVIL